MDGKWDNASAALLNNVQEFERLDFICSFNIFFLDYFLRVLTKIRQYMDHLVSSKWVQRVLLKSSIESELSDYAAMLDDAHRSFQV